MKISDDILVHAQDGMACRLAPRASYLTGEAA